MKSCVHEFIVKQGWKDNGDIRIATISSSCYIYKGSIFPSKSISDEHSIVNYIDHNTLCRWANSNTNDGKMTCKEDAIQQYIFIDIDVSHWNEWKCIQKMKMQYVYRMFQMLKYVWPQYFFKNFLCTTNCLCTEVLLWLRENFACAFFFSIVCVIYWWISPLCYTDLVIMTN